MLYTLQVGLIHDNHIFIIQTKHGEKMFEGQLVRAQMRMYNWGVFKLSRVKLKDTLPENHVLHACFQQSLYVNRVCLSAIYCVHRFQITKCVTNTQIKKHENQLNKSLHFCLVIEKFRDHYR